MKTRLLRAIIWAVLGFTGLLFPLAPAGAQEINLEINDAQCLQIICEKYCAPENFSQPENSEPTTQQPVALNQNYKIRINEFQPHPLANQKEWIELFLEQGENENPNLDGWWLEDSKSKIFELTFEHKFENKFLTIELPSNKLNNGGDTVKLFDVQGVLVSEVLYKEELPKQGETIAYDFNLKKYVITITPTKNFENSINTSAQTKIPETEEINSSPAESSGETESEFLQGSDEPTQNTSDTQEPPTKYKLIINELLPNPVGSDNYEFVEIFNPEDVVVDLSGWILKDASTSFIFTDEKIEPHSYLMLPRTKTKIALNNSGEETVELVDSFGEIISAVIYSKSFEGESFVFDEGVWKWTTTPTAGLPNMITLSVADSENSSGSSSGSESKDDKPVQNVLLSEIKNLELGTMIKTSGVVSVLPDVFGSQYFYLAGSGVQIYMYKKDFPEFVRGDILEIVGEVSESRGERRIKTKTQEDIVVMAGGDEFLPYELEIEEISSEHIGSLIKVTGAVTDTNSSYIYIDNGKSEIRIELKTVDLNFAEADKVEVVGIVRPKSDDLAIYPRDENDFIIEKTDDANTPPVLGAATPEGNFPWLKIIVVGTLIGTLFWLFKKFNVGKNIKSKPVAPMHPAQKRLALQPIRANQIKLVGRSDDEMDEEIEELVKTHKELQN